MLSRQAPWLACSPRWNLLLDGNLIRPLSSCAFWRKQCSSSNLALWLWKQIPTTLLFRPHNQILTFSAFQTLLMFLSWINFLVTPCAFIHGCILHGAYNPIDKMPNGKLFRPLKKGPSYLSPIRWLTLNPPSPNKWMPPKFFCYSFYWSFLFLWLETFNLVLWWTFLTFLKAFVSK